MNKIRAKFTKEVDALLPVLHEAYRQIGRYQSNRSEQNTLRVLEHLDIVGERVTFFRKLVQTKKRAYFDAIVEQTLSVSDRIIALDIAVGTLHIGFPMERAYMHQESEELRRVLELSRWDGSDAVRESGDTSEDILARGIPASPGIVTGKAAIVRKNSDYRRLPAGCIVVARMTRTEMVFGLERIMGIVTDIGGSLCHAAIVAREKGIPCVVGTGDATTRIKNRALVSVDGNSGVVSKAWT